MSKMVKFVEGQMYTYEIYKLVDPYSNMLHQPTQEWNFDNPPVVDGSTLFPGDFACSLVETMTKLGGLGLAANQVGFPYKVCCIAAANKAYVMFNPKITMVSGGYSDMKEGCLSYPGLFLKINRASMVTVDFQAIDGAPMTLSFEGIQAICIQHEIDHLNGVCYTKQVSPIVLEREKRKMKTNLKKMRRAAQQNDVASLSY